MTTPDTRRSHAVVSLAVRTADDQMHTMTWWLPACHDGAHVEEFRALMLASAGPPASETLRSREQAEQLADATERARGVEL